MNINKPHWLCYFKIYYYIVTVITLLSMIIPSPDPSNMTTTLNNSLT